MENPSHNKTVARQIDDFSQILGDAVEAAPDEESDELAGIEVPDFPEEEQVEEPQSFEELDEKELKLLC